MFKSIFTKLMAVNIFVMFICMVITSMLFFSFLGDFTIGQNRKSLFEDSKRVNNMTIYFLENQSKGTEKLYYMNIEGISNKLDAIIFITNNEGNVIISSKRFENFSNTSSINSEFIKDVIAGKESTKVTDFDGMFDEECLVVGVPLKRNETIIGATCLAIPVPEVLRYRREIFKISLIAMLIAIAISSIFWYFLSFYITKPLKNLNQVAKRISEGDFKVRVKVLGKDEIAQLGKTFNNMATSLENLENVRSSFIANVSHELRTPMTTISGFVEGILDGTIPEKEHAKYLSIVMGETNRLARLISELLVLTRIESGKSKPHMMAFDINELIRVSVLSFEKQITQKEINVDINFAEDKTMVLADKDAISRVLINLFDNAIKFNFKNGYLKIWVEEKDKKVFVYVENSGIGIKADELNFIWDRFYKTDKSRGYDKKGVGLGLYLVQNIISSHGEKIWVKSENNSFARFAFSLASVNKNQIN